MRPLISPRCILLLGLLLVTLTIGTPVAQATTPGLLITEVQAANTRTVADDQGSYSDWIELHNPTDTSISLAGYTLTDDPTQPAKWSLPASTLAPDAFLVVWASGLDQVTPDDWHTSFRLNRAGEYVGLFGPDGQLVDAVTFGPQLTDVSLGRLAGSNQWVAFSTPTPGAANTTRPRAVPGAPQVLVTPVSGRFVGPVTVQLEAPVGSAAVYYTLDGANPTVDGQAYTAPLEVTETTVLRAVALDARAPVSAVTTATYLVGASTRLPVLSLVTDPAHLWDEATGIYVNPEERGRNWEQPVTVEWLSPEGERGFNVDAGLRIHGNISRNTPKQSFRLYFRGEYGPRVLAYPLFGPEPVTGQSRTTPGPIRAALAGQEQMYDRLVLRSGAQDSWQCSHFRWCPAGEVVYVRDQLVRDLHGAMGQIVVQGRWVEVYLNGVYWGLYNLTERIDDAFLATHFDHDDWDVVVANTGRGPVENAAWEEFASWLIEADLSEVAQYEQAAQQLDIASFTSYVLLNLWAQNEDWLGENWIVVRPRGGTDGRWRFFIWDAEATFGSTENTFDYAVNGDTLLGQVLASLLRNAQYRAYFAAQTEQYLAGVLDTAAVRERLDALAAELRPAMAAEAARWLSEQEPAVAVAQWEAALQRLSNSLEGNAQRLRQLSAPETLRQLLPPRAAPKDPAPPLPLPPGTRIALVVDRPAELTPGDAAVAAHLAARGAMVTVIEASDGSAPDPTQVAASHDLLLLSSSIIALDGAARYAQTTTPLIFWEPLLLERRPRLSPQGGTRSRQTDIRIVDTDHPITTGLPVDQPFRVARWTDTLSVAWPTNGPGVQVLAKHLFGGDYAILVAETGAELANGQRAPARTVFWFWHHDTFRRSTGEAVRLFDRAVDWALGLSPDAGAWRAEQCAPPLHPAPTSC